MSGSSTSLSPEFALRMDQVCDDFESAWRHGDRQRIEDLINNFDGSERDEVLLELVRVEVDLLRSAGEKPKLADYQSRFPNVNWLPVFGDSDTELFAIPSNGARTLPKIPGYEILRRLGRGGMGVVFQARHLRLNRMVALKMVEGTSRSDELLSRFQREAEAIALLQHPHIVQIHEVGESDGQPFLALEYIDGGNLADRIRGEPQSATQAAQLVETLARTIHSAHERGVVHRDLKPANILLVNPDGASASGSSWTNERTARAGTTYGVPKIADFGLSKRRDDERDITVTGAIFGTPSYMAPEQAVGDTSSLGPGVDVYALGVILYEMLTGRPPFKAPTAFETIELVRSADPLPPTKLQPHIPRDLEVICLKCLQKEASARYHSALELADELGRFLNGEPILTRPVSAFERAVKWARRHPAGAWLIALSSVSVLVLIGLWAGFTSRLAEERKFADNARISAEKSRDSATKSSGEAIEARIDAEAARDDALSAKERARRTTYASHIQLAYREWLDGNVARMRSILDGPGCVPKSEGERDWRNWEWYFLSSLRETSFRKFSNPILRGPRPRVIPAEDGYHTTSFSPDGRKLLVTDWLAGRGLHVFDVSTGTCEKTLTEHEGPVQSIDFSPDERWLVTAGRINAGTFLRDAHTHQVVYELPHPDHVSSVVFTPNSQRVITSCWDSKIRIWDVETGSKLAEWQVSDSPLLNLQLSHNGQHLATCGFDSLVRLWTPAKDDTTGLVWVEEAKLTGHRNQTSGMAFSPNDELLASSSEDGEIRLWNVRERRLITPFRHHQRWVFHLTFSPDGRWLAAGSDDGTISLIDPLTLRVDRTLRGHDGSVRDVKFSPDGSWLASVGLDRQINLWDLTRTSDEFDEFAGPRQRMLDVLITPNGKSVVTACRDGHIRLWDINSRTLLRNEKISTNELLTLALSPDGRLIAVSAFESVPVLRVVDTKSWKVVAELRGHKTYVKAMDFSPDSRQLASGSLDGKLFVWDISQQQIVQEASEPLGKVVEIAWRPETQQLVIGTNQSDVMIWDVDRQQIVKRLPGHAEGVETLAVFDHGRRVVVASGDQQIRVWNLNNGQLEHSHFGHAAAISKLRVSPDNQRLATASYDHTIRLWDLPTGLELMALEPSTEVEYALAFDPQRGRLIEISAGGAMRIWEAPQDPLRHHQKRRERRIESPPKHEASLLHCLAQGNLQGAQVYLNHLAATDPEHPSLLRYEADIAVRSRNWKVAAEAYSAEIERQPRSSQLTPDFRDLFHRASYCWQRSGIESGHLRTLQQQLDWFGHNSDQITANALAWNCCFGPLDFDIARRGVAQAQRSVGFGANDSNLNTLGTIYLVVGYEVDAIAAIERGMAINPNGIGYNLDWYVLAIAHHRLGNDLVARKWFDKAHATWQPVATLHSKEPILPPFTWETAEVELFDEWATKELATPIKLPR